MARLISFLSSLTRACACLSQVCLSEYSKRDVYNLIYVSACVFGVYRGCPGVCTMECLTAARVRSGEPLSC